MLGHNNKDNRGHLASPQRSCALPAIAKPLPFPPPLGDDGSSSSSNSTPRGRPEFMKPLTTLRERNRLAQSSPAREGRTSALFNTGEAAYHQPSTASILQPETARVVLHHRHQPRPPGLYRSPSCTEDNMPGSSLGYWTVAYCTHGGREVASVKLHPALLRIPNSERSAAGQGQVCNARGGFSCQQILDEISYDASRRDLQLSHVLYLDGDFKTYNLLTPKTAQFATTGRFRAVVITAAERLQAQLELNQKTQRMQELTSSAQALRCSDQGSEEALLRRDIDVAMRLLDGEFEHTDATLQRMHPPSPPPSVSTPPPVATPPPRQPYVIPMNIRRRIEKLLQKNVEEIHDLEREEQLERDMFDQSSEVSHILLHYLIDCHLNDMDRAHLSRWLEKEYNCCSDIHVGEMNALRKQVRAALEEEEIRDEERRLERFLTAPPRTTSAEPADDVYDMEEDEEDDVYEEEQSGASSTAHSAAEPEATTAAGEVEPLNPTEMHKAAPSEDEPTPRIEAVEDDVEPERTDMLGEQVDANGSQELAIVDSMKSPEKQDSSSNPPCPNEGVEAAVIESVQQQAETAAKPEDSPHSNISSSALPEEANSPESEPEASASLPAAEEAVPESAPPPYEAGPAEAEATTPSVNDVLPASACENASPPQLEASLPSTEKVAQESPSPALLREASQGEVVEAVKTPSSESAVEAEAEAAAEQFSRSEEKPTTPPRQFVASQEASKSPLVHSSSQPNSLPKTSSSSLVDVGTKDVQSSTSLHETSPAEVRPTSPLSQSTIEEKEVPEASTLADEAGSPQPQPEASLPSEKEVTPQDSTLLSQPLQPNVAAKPSCETSPVEESRDGLPSSDLDADRSEKEAASELASACDLPEKEEISWRSSSVPMPLSPPPSEERVEDSLASAEESNETVDEMEEPEDNEPPQRARAPSPDVLVLTDPDEELEEDIGNRYDVVGRADGDGTAEFDEPSDEEFEEEVEEEDVEEIEGEGVENFEQESTIERYVYDGSASSSDEDAPADRDHTLEPPRATATPIAAVLSEFSEPASPAEGETEEEMEKEEEVEEAMASSGSEDEEGSPSASEGSRNSTEPDIVAVVSDSRMTRASKSSLSEDAGAANPPATTEDPDSPQPSSEDFYEVFKRNRATPSEREGVRSHYEDYISQMMAHPSPGSSSPSRDQASAAEPTSPSDQAEALQLLPAYLDDHLPIDEEVMKILCESEQIVCTHHRKPLPGTEWEMVLRHSTLFFKKEFLDDFSDVMECDPHCVRNIVLHGEDGVVDFDYFHDVRRGPETIDLIIEEFFFPRLMALYECRNFLKELGPDICPEGEEERSQERTTTVPTEEELDAIENNREDKIEGAMYAESVKASMLDAGEPSSEQHAAPAPPTAADDLTDEQLDAIEHNHDGKIEGAMYAESVKASMLDAGEPSAEQQAPPPSAQTDDTPDNQLDTIEHNHDGKVDGFVCNESENAPMFDAGEPSSEQQAAPAPPTAENDLTDEQVDAIEQNRDDRIEGATHADSVKAAMVDAGEPSAEQQGAPPPQPADVLDQDEPDATGGPDSARQEVFAETDAVEGTLPTSTAEAVDPTASTTASVVALTETDDSPNRGKVSIRENRTESLANSVYSDTQTTTDLQETTESEVLHSVEVMEHGRRSVRQLLQSAATLRYPDHSYGVPLYEWETGLPGSSASDMQSRTDTTATYHSRSRSSHRGADYHVHRLWMDLTADDRGFALEALAQRWKDTRPLTIAHGVVHLTGEEWSKILECCPLFLRDQFVSEVCGVLHLDPAYIRNVALCSTAHHLQVHFDMVVENSPAVKTASLLALQQHAYDLLQELYAVRAQMQDLHLEAALVAQGDLPLLAFEHGGCPTDTESSVSPPSSSRRLPSKPLSARPEGSSRRVRQAKVEIN